MSVNSLISEQTSSNVGTWPGVCGDLHSAAVTKYSVVYSTENHMKLYAELKLCLQFGVTYIVCTE